MRGVHCAPLYSFLCGYKMGRKKSVGINYIYNVSYQILAVLTPLITTPYLSRKLGVEGIGDFSYTQSIVLIFAMFAALGTVIYGNREVSYVQNDKKEYSKVFWNVEFLSLVSVLVVSIFYGFFIAFQTQFIQLYLIQSITLISVATNISWLFQGLEEIQKVVFRNILFRLLSIVYIFVFIKKQEDLALYVAGYVVLECLGNISIWIYLPKYVERPHLKDIHLWKHFKGTLLLFAPTIATTIYTLFDKTMIGLFTESKIENGYYEQAMKLSKTALTIVTALEAVMIPRVGALFVEKKEEELKELMYKVYRFVWFLSFPIAFGLFSIAGVFVPVFYGEGFDKVTPLLRVLCFLLPCIGISNVTGVQYLMSTKRERFVTRTVMIGACVNLILNLILIPQMFSVGAAIASLVAEFLIAAIQLFLIREELQVPRILKSGWKYLIAAALMTVAILTEEHFLVDVLSNAGITVIMIASGIIVYFVLLLLLRDEMLKTYLDKLLHKFFKMEK